MRTAIGILGFILLLAAFGAAVWYFGFREVALSPSAGGEAGALYTFNDAGLYFQYPQTYTFESYPLEDDTESWTSLMLVRTKDKEQAEANGASEGPVAITVGIFDAQSGQSLEDWIKSDSHSNFALSPDQKLTPQTVGGEPALAYEHSGLFENDAVAVIHGGKIYLFEASWADANDPLRSDFQNLLKTLQFK
jgi:hypothetical protein